jgi:hypothetical protein
MLHILNMAVASGGRADPHIIRFSGQSAESALTQIVAPGGKQSPPVDDPQCATPEDTLTSTCVTEHSRGKDLNVSPKTPANISVIARFTMKRDGREVS